MTNMCEKALERIRKAPRRPSPAVEALLESARLDPDLRAIIDVDPNATVEDVQKAIDLVRELQKKEEKE